MKPIKIKTKTDGRNTKTDNKPRKTNLNKSKSQNVPDLHKSSYNTRANPRQSFLNSSLSSVTQLRNQTVKPNFIKNLNKNLSNKSSGANKKLSPPVTKIPSAASRIKSLSRPSVSYQNQSSGLLPPPASSVPHVADEILPILSHQPSSSPKATLPIDQSHASDTPRQDVVANYSTDLLSLERDTTLSEPVALPVTRATPSSATKDKYIPSRVAVYSDSMCRGVGDMMLTILPSTFAVISDIMPGAVFSQVTKYIASECNDYSPNDYVFIQAGTNDIVPLQPNSSKRLRIPASLYSLSNKTNVIFCSIPYRYDTLAHLSTYICETNYYFQYLCSRSHFKYLDSNNFMSRPLYTKEGLHYNSRGEKIARL